MNEITEPIFGNWYIEETIGRGSFGTVYKIKREEFDTIYHSALKVIKIPQASSDVASLQGEGMNEQSISEYYTDLAHSFVKEIELLAALKGNSNVVSYEDHAIIPNDDGIGYTILIRMELLKPLTAYLTEHEFTQKDVIQLGIDMCRALELCEAKKIIHRDIKPENIFVSDSGSFKLGDFGVARQMEKTMSSLSQKGTYTYMAPEVYLGTSYDSTVDIYSLGIVLYRLFNHNRTPFLPAPPAPIKHSDRENAQIMRMRGDKIPDIRDIPPELNSLVMVACDYNPAGRFQSATAFRNSLEYMLKSLKNNSNTVTTLAETNVLYSANSSAHNSSIKFADGTVIAVENNSIYSNYRRGVRDDIKINIVDEAEEESNDSFQGNFGGYSSTTIPSSSLSGFAPEGVGIASRSKEVSTVTDYESNDSEKTISSFSSPAVVPSNYQTLISPQAEILQRQLKKKSVLQWIFGVIILLISLLCMYFISIWGGAVLLVNSVVLMAFGGSNGKKSRNTDYISGGQK